jgi:hypothetical protein
MKPLAQSAPRPGALPALARNRLVDVVVRESPLVIALACSAAVLFGHLAMQFAADSWLNLLSGREIVEHGLPHHDALAVVSRGHEWIDQQWLAHLFYYGAYLVGGLGFSARVNVLVFLVAVGAVYWFARRRRVGAVAVVLCSVPMLILGIEFIRAQVLAEPLFVALVALLASESRHRTRRVALAFPILVLWANIHGSVVLGAVLVTTLGFVELARGSRRADAATARAIALIALPLPCIFASPYGSALVTYYKATLHNPEFSRHLTEWASPTFGSLAGVLLLVTALLAAALVARRPRDLTAYELAVLAITLLGALQAVRSIVWFVIAAGMLVPELLSRELGRAEPDRGLTTGPRALIMLATGAAAFLAALSVTHPGPGLANDWPPAAQRAIDGVLRSDSHARVLASYDVADWVLFRSSLARGRIAFDGRWEILNRKEFLSAMRLLGGDPRLARGYRVVVVRPASARQLYRWAATRPGAQVRFRSLRLVVLDLGRAADPKP